jgi:hypothetical protein
MGQTIQGSTTGRGKRFLLLTSSIPSLTNTKPPLQGTPRALPQIQNGRCVKFTIYLHLLLWSCICTSAPPVCLYVVKRDKFAFHLYFS